MLISDDPEMVAFVSDHTFVIIDFQKHIESLHETFRPTTLKQMYLSQQA